MKGKDESGLFLPGNRFWEARSSHGAKPKFANGDDLWSACCEYFEWNTSNPLYEAKAFAFQGAVTVENLPKMRAMTIGALCLFIDITQKQWIEWRSNRADLSEVITRAEAIIFAQKFEGASADLLNASIIARELGLADKSEITGANGGPIQSEDVTHGAESFAQRMARLAAASVPASRTGETDGGGEG